MESVRKRAAFGKRFSINFWERLPHREKNEKSSVRLWKIRRGADFAGSLHAARTKALRQPSKLLRPPAMCTFTAGLLNKPPAAVMLLT